MYFLSPYLPYDAKKPLKKYLKVQKVSTLRATGYGFFLVQKKQQA